MSPLEATEAIYAAAKAGVALMSGTPTLFLEAERGKPAAGTAWIRVTVRDLPTLPLTLAPPGERYAQRSGLLIAQCFAPIGTTDGVSAAMAMALAFRALFEGQDIIGAGSSPTSINFREADVRRVGIDKGGWFQVNAECPFTFGEIV